MSEEMETEGTVENETNQNGIEAESFAQLSNDALAKLLELAADMVKNENVSDNADFLKTTVRALTTKVLNGTKAGPYASLIDRLLQAVEDLQSGNITDSMKETAGALYVVLPSDGINANAVDDLAPAMFGEGGFKDEDEEDTGITGQLHAPDAAGFPAVDSVQKQSLFDPDSVSNEITIEDSIIKHGKDLKKVTDVPQSASSTRRNLRLWVDSVRKILQKWKEDGNRNTSQDRLLPSIQQVVTYLEKTEQQEPDLFNFKYWWRFAWVLENQDKFSSDAEICLVLILCSASDGRKLKAAKVAGEQGKYSKKRKQPGSDANPTSGET